MITLRLAHYSWMECPPNGQVIGKRCTEERLEFREVNGTGEPMTNWEEVPTVHINHEPS